MLLVILMMKTTLLLTNTQVSKLSKAFANNYSANIQLSKTQLHRIGQSRGTINWDTDNYWFNWKYIKIWQKKYT